MISRFQHKKENTTNKAIQKVSKKRKADIREHQKGISAAEERRLIARCKGSIDFGRRLDTSVSQ